MVNGLAIEVIASGGIGSLSDVRHVRDCGAAGVIIGAALYHQHVSLGGAIAVASEPLTTPEEQPG